MYHILADVIILIHFLFIILVIAGGLLVIRWPKIAFVHLPAAIWGAVVEIGGFICPLTPLENYFRQLAGENPYEGDFIAHYLSQIIYPENLTATMQLILGIFVIVINIIFYALAIHRNRTGRTPRGCC